MSAADVFIRVSAFVAAMYLVNRGIDQKMNEIDFTELQEIVQECTELDIRDIKYIDSSDSGQQSISIAGKINKDKEFAWKTDEEGVYVIPDRLKKYIGVSDLKVVEMNPFHNYENNDILIVSEDGGDTKFSEAFLKIRTERNSSKFIQIPVVTLAMKQKLLAQAINELLHIDETTEQLHAMIEELIDEE